MKNLIYIFIAAVLTTACSVSRCREPEVKTPERLVVDLTDDTLCIADLSWVEIIADTLLVNLINDALEHNKDLLVAGARIKEYESLHKAQRSSLFPSIGFESYYDRETTEKGGGNSVEALEASAKMTFSWEIDFFGRLRWADKEALADYMQTIEARRAVQMTLIADVATAYFELLALDKEMQIVQGTIATRQVNVRQAQLRFDAGLISEIPYQQTQVELAKAASMLPDLKMRIRMKENELSFLTGSLPSDIERSTIDSDLVSHDQLSVGIPSEILKRRPDVRVAEYELQKTMSRVGYSWADRFPRFVIELEGGFENNGFEGLLKSPLTYALGELTSPVFSFGQKKAKHKAALQAYEAECLRYEEKVIQAFREVDDAIAGYRAARENTAVMLSLKTSSQKYVELARFQYLNGQINYLDVLDAQRSNFDAEIEHSNAIRDQYLALINMYKALGGGWK